MNPEFWWAVTRLLNTFRVFLWCWKFWTKTSRKYIWSFALIQFANSQHESPQSQNVWKSIEEGVRAEIVDRKEGVVRAC